MSSLFKHLSGDRRSAPRQHIKVPLRYRLRTPSAIEHTAESENLSDVGISFHADIDLTVGSVVDIVVEMPMESNGPSVQWLFTGHVVRVECNDSRCVRNRIGIQFDCYEILPDEVCQPANLVVPNFSIPRAVN